MIIPKQTRVAVKRVLWVFFPAVLVLAVGIGVLDFYLIQKMTHPAPTQLYGSPRDYQVILQKPMWFDKSWPNSDGTQSAGWFLSQGRPAPAIILSHAYGSNRSELLTIGFELWKAGYHVLLFDLRGHGESPVKWSGLGTYEKEDLLSAIGFLKRLKSDAGQELLDGRIGLYGVELGGYISIVASAQDPAVKAVAVDSVFPDVAHFIKHRLMTYLGNDSALAGKLVDARLTGELTDLAVQLYLFRREDFSPALEAVKSTSVRRFLFLTAKDGGDYQKMTEELHLLAHEPKELAYVEHTRLDRLYVKDSSDYDARVIAFFRVALPIQALKSPIASGAR